MRKNEVGSLVGLLVGGALLMLVFSEIANNPRISPLWRKIAQTAEGDVYQHIIDGTIVTILG